MNGSEVGRIAGLWRYPVKSMAAQSLHAADISWHGVAGDRRYAFVREGLERSGFPWLTIREHSGLGSYEPFLFRIPAAPMTQTWSCARRQENSWTSWIRRWPGSSVTEST